MKLSILIPHLRSRDALALISSIKDQIHAADDEVGLCIDGDNGERTSGQKRQLLMEDAGGEYVCFVDDDDTVADDYVEQLLEGCHSGADVVTFNAAITGIPTSVSTHSMWQFGLTDDLRQHGLMTVNHLCAWKRSIATMVGWCPELGFGDDQLWYQPLFYSGIVKTQFHIDKCLYRYNFNQQTTANCTAERIALSREYVGEGLRCFWWSEQDIVIEVPEEHRVLDQLVRVRDRHNRQFLARFSDLRHFHTITLH